MGVLTFKRPTVDMLVQQQLSRGEGGGGAACNQLVTILCLLCSCCPLCCAASFMTAVSNAIFTEVEEDVRACEAALQAVGERLQDKPTTWRRRRIRRTIKPGHVIEARLKQLVETYRPLVCPETGESVVTPDLEAAIANALERVIPTAEGLKSAVQLLEGA